jgi:hypothetical protein
VEGDAVGPGGEDLLDGPGRDHPDRVDAHDLAGIPPHLLRRVAVQPHELEVRLVPDPLDHLPADVAGGDLEDPQPVPRVGLSHLVCPLRSGFAPILARPAAA